MKLESVDFETSDGKVQDNLTAKDKNVGHRDMAERTGVAKPKKQLMMGMIALIVGLTVLAVGVVMLIKTLSNPDPRDAEYLVSVGKWVREDEPSVIWDFTEIGAGTLTTNAHANDYDFIWAIERNELKVETKWLYDLNDAFEYEIRDGKLILDNGIVFVPVEAE